MNSTAQMPASDRCANMPPVSESDYLRALCRIGARWKHKRTREVETVTGVDGQFVETDKHRLLIKELLHKYRPLVDEKKRGPALAEVLGNVAKQKRRIREAQDKMRLGR